MRKNRENQLPLSPLWPDHQLAKELRVISEILDENPSISDLVLQDVCDKASARNGAGGLTADQVLRCALIKQMHQFSYEKLAFHLSDSQSFRTFCRLPYGYTPSKSVLQENISKMEDSTWQKINRVLVSWADQEGLEKGRKIRVDATSVESDIRYPTDSQLLYDAIRVLTRLMRRLSQRQSVAFVDHSRRAKRRWLNIRNSRGERRKKHYQDLLQVAGKTRSYAREAIQSAEAWSDPISQALAHYLDLLERVMDQTQRRVLGGEKVPASEKWSRSLKNTPTLLKKGRGRVSLVINFM